MSKYDTIVEVEKSIDEITEVQKFNPFHDSRGRFASSSGFKSYSANPNTRAGAMAIARSAAAGHMNTVNVHRDAQSTGTTIRQNANWLGQGKQQTPGQSGSATLNRRVEPVAGLAGASATGASWQYQNQQQGRTTKPGKQTQQQQAQQNQQQQQTKPAAQKPAQQQQQTQQQTPQNQQSLKAQVSNVRLGAGDKLAIVPRNESKQPTTTTKVANDHDQSRVAGSDISKTADVRKIKGKDPIDAMAELQGWNKAPTVTNDLETFQKAVKQSGITLARSVHDSRVTGETGTQVCKSTMTNGDYALGGSGGQAYGSGIYMVGTTLGTSTGKSMSIKIASGQKHSFGYGDKQMMATVHPDAKIATPTQGSTLKSQFNRMTATQKARFGNDFGAFIASKGYDGVNWHGASDPEAYVTIYNKSALIFYGGVASDY